MASFLIKDVRIFDGTSSIESGSVLVEHGKISKVSSSPISFSGTTYSKPGHTLLPGLIDVHIHADSGNDIALPQSLRFGVTTVCDMHNEYPNIEKLRKQIQGGDCADLKCTSFAATVEMGWPAPIILMHNDNPQTRAEIASWPKLATAEDAQQYVADRVKEGANYIKLMHESGTTMGQKFNKPSLELQKAVISEAHKAGLKAVAHATCLADTLEILECGVDGLTHTFVDQAPTEELLKAYQKNNAWCNPTLACMGSGTTEGKQLQEKFAHDPRVGKLLDERGRESMCACMAFARNSGSSVQHSYDTVKMLKRNGVDVLCGSDSAGPAVGTAWGLSMHQELSLLVNQCDFSPSEALAAAISLPAKRFGFSDRGSIKQGLSADMMLVEGNPLSNIDDTLNLKGAWREGKLCSTFSGLS